MTDLPSYVAGALPPVGAAEVQAHLETCLTCRTAGRSEAALHEALTRVTADTGEEAVDAVWRLVDAARARADLGAPVPQERAADFDRRLPGRPWGRRLLRTLLAAGLLVVAGLVITVGPCVWGDCPTARILLRAAAARIGTGPTAGVEAVAPPLPGLRAVGVAKIAGLPAALYERGETRLVVLRSAKAHAHFWQVKRLEDGRAYVDLLVNGERIVGWVDDRGDLWCCVGRDAPSVSALARHVRKTMP